METTIYCAMMLDIETGFRTFFGAAEYGELAGWIRQWRIDNPGKNTVAFDIREQSPIC